MKSTICILFICCLLCFAASAQSISISEKNATLVKLFSIIKQQTDYTFFYSDNDIKKAKLITIEVKNASLISVLDECFKDQPLTYSIIEKTIVIKLKPQPKIDDSVSSSPPIDVHGKVIDESGQPVVNASVTIKGNKSKGTSTDENGNFVLKGVDVNAVLLISGVNFVTYEINVAARTNLDLITVRAKIVEIEEVIVNAGYYKTADKLRTGSIVKIGGKDIEKQPVTSLLLALQGRVPGLDIKPTTGAASSAPVIEIRGRSSVRGNSLESSVNGPLIIIDGVPIDATPLRTSSLIVSVNGFDVLSSLSPESIESIEVLKDADATAIYGSRGANGVILITTKKAIGGKTNIDIHAYHGVGKIVNRMELLNTQQYLQMRMEAFAQDGAIPNAYDFDVNGTWDNSRFTDWQKELLGGHVNTSSVSVALTGGNDKTSFRFGANHYREGVLYPGDFGYNRSSGELSLNHVSTDKRFNATFSINYGSTNNKLVQDGNFVNQALMLPPNAPPLYLPNGDINWQIKQIGNSYITTFGNPIASLKNTLDVTAKNIISSGSFTYKIISNLFLKANLGITDLNSNELAKYPIAAIAPTNGGRFGESIFGYNQRRSWIAEPQLLYSFHFGNHKFNTLIGSTWQENIGEFRSISGRGYTSDILLNSMRAAPTIVFNADFSNKYRYNALFGRIGYNYRSKYVMQFSGRRDGSSRFGPNKQFGTFWAIGGGWIFTEESFMKKIDKILSFGKFRFSYGLTGNDQIGDYKFYDTYTLSQYPYQGNPSLSPTSLFNPDFNWETTKKAEAALELGFFRDRIRVEVSYYQHRSSNQLANYELPTTTGFTSVLANLNATVGNSGLEGTLRFDFTKNRALRWITSLNISANQNKLIAFPGIETTPYANLFKVGQPLAIQKLYDFIRINPQTGEYEIRDINNDGIINSDDKEFADPLDRKFFGGINNSFSYKSIELSFLFQFVQQMGYSYSYSPPGSRYTNMPIQVLWRWTKPGDVTNIGRFTRGFSNNSYANVQLSDYFLTDASFIRLKSLSLSYNLKQELIKRLGLEEATIYFQGQNLLTFSSFLAFDPETGTSMPPLLSMIVGVQLKF